MENSKPTQSKMKLIVSDDKNPSVTLKPGMKLQVVAVDLVEPNLKASKKIAARLCSGGGTCVALIEI